MGDIHGTRTTQEVVPYFDWIEDSMGHHLLVHLPGFKEEDVMVGLAYPGYVTISGERIVNDEKSIYFGQALKLPDSNLDTNKIDQSFEDEMLTLTFPKRIEELMNGENQRENGNPSTAKNNSQEELIKGENQRKHEVHCHAENEEQSKQTDDHVINGHKEMTKDGGILERAINLLKDHIVLTVVLAFSLGVLVSKRFESNGE